MSEQERMQQMQTWLEIVCRELNLDQQVIMACVPEILDMARQVAHGPSRPGTPVTAFCLGLVAAQDARIKDSAQAPQVLREAMSKLAKDLAPYADKE